MIYISKHFLINFSYADNFFYFCCSQRQNTLDVRAGKRGYLVRRSICEVQKKCIMLIQLIKTIMQVHIINHD